MSIPSVPPVADADRYVAYQVNGASTTTVNVPFPIYGDASDLDVQLDGVSYNTNAWSLVSASGTPLANLPSPITDGQIVFAQAVTPTLIEIYGAIHPRMVAMGTQPGLARREYNWGLGYMLSSLREVWARVRKLSASPLGFDASGPLASKSTYDDEAKGFRYFVTDDASGRPIIYIKMSATHADWSQALIYQGPSGASGSTWYTGSGVPSNGTGINGDYYLRSSNGEVYKKVTGAWVDQGYSLIGPSGASGFYLAADATTTAIASTDYFVIQTSGPTGKRILRDNVLKLLPPHRRVTALWTGEEQGSQSAGLGTGPIVIMADGSVRAWGGGTTYGNGDPSAGHRYAPQTVAFDQSSVSVTMPIIQAARSGSSFYLLDTAGVVWAAGDNSAGQLGLGDTTARRRLTPLTAFTGGGIVISRIVPMQNTDGGGYANSSCYFITSTGAVYGCGLNTNGILGDNTVTQRTSPVRAGTLTNITKLVAVCGSSANTNNSFVYALDSSNNLYAWGWNGLYQLGDGTTTARWQPYLTATGVVDMAATGARNATDGGSGIYVKSNGEVWAIGYNGTGQLGIGSTVNATAWTKVGAFSTGSKVWMGGGVYGSTVLLLNDGNIRTWGRNANGQLGVGSTTQQTSPATPTGSYQGLVTKAHVGGSSGDTISIMLLCSDGSIWVSGYNANGQLGQGNNFASISTFAQLKAPLIDGAKFTDARFYGVYNTLSLVALDENGRLWATGKQDNGGLGTQPGNLHDVDFLERVLFA